MKISRVLSVIALVLMGMLLLAACGGSAEPAADEHADGDGHADSDDHGDDDHGDMDMDHEHVDPPSEFASLRNPYADDEEAIAAGKTIFETNCLTCHGEEGHGDGPAAVGLDPGPADLGDGDMMGMLTDGYLFWRVTKGGAIEPFNSAMPTWEQVLNEDQRWQVISYVRTLSDHSH